MYIKPCLQLQRSQSKWSWNGDKPGSVFLLPVSAAFALKRNIHLPCVARVNPMFFGFVHFNFLSVLIVAESGFQSHGHNKGSAKISLPNITNLPASGMDAT